MLLSSIMIILFSNAVNLRRDISILYNRIGMLTLLYCMVITSWTAMTKGIGLHGGLLLITDIIQVFQTFVYLISFLILVLTSFYSRKIWTSKLSYWISLLFNKLSYYNTKVLNKMGEQFKIMEYPLILLFIISGAVFLMSTNDLISIFLAIELQSYGLYILSSIYRNSELATTGGLMYFLLGGLSSCFILLGTGLLYSNSGNTNLDSLYVITGISDMNSTVYSIGDLWYKPYYINIALIIFAIGFLFKVSAAPFHFWSPDIYDAIPTIVTTFVALIAKISVFILLLQLVYYTTNTYSDSSFNNWTFILLLSSFFSLIIGTIVGLTQFRIKRLLAYSTISHVGFILLALAISTVESTQAFLFYLTQYIISNLNVFFIIIAIGFSLYCYVSNNLEYKELLDKNNSPIQLITQLRGFFSINPFIAISLAITIFSFAGIPPLVGFFGKQMVLSAALSKGLMFLSIIAILTSVIGGFYYLNIVKELFFHPSEYKVNSVLTTPLLNVTITKNTELAPQVIGSWALPTEKVQIYYNNISISSPITFVIASITLIILLFILINKEWLSMGTVLGQILFNN